VDFTSIVEVIVTVVEATAIVILAGGVTYVLGAAIGRLLRRVDHSQVYHGTRRSLGRVLLLGLEVLIAADIIATVALELTLQNVAALGLLVVVRTFLSWTIEVETDGRWPWQAPGRETPAAT
jgi:uncharacterized membrane protein